MKTRTTHHHVSGKLPTRSTKAKVNYNEHKLAEAAFKPAPAKKLIVKKTKKAAVKGKKGKGPTYLAIVKKVLREKVKKDNKNGLSLQALLKYIEKLYPDRTNRRYVRLALVKGVAAKSLVQTRQTFRLSAKEQQRIAKKKKSTKKGAKKSTKKSKKTSGAKGEKKKKTGTKRKAPAEKAKKSTKKASTGDKKPKKPAAKKARVAAAPATEAAPEGTIAEGAGKGVWQYYDNGWHDYDAGASDIVEGVYQEYKASPGTGLDVRAVKSGYFNYTVDFLQMKQTNIQTGTTRNIQRRLE